MERVPVVSEAEEGLEGHDSLSRSLTQRSLCLCLSHSHPLPLPPTLSHPRSLTHAPVVSEAEEGLEGHDFEGLQQRVAHPLSPRTCRPPRPENERERECV